MHVCLYKRLQHFREYRPVNVAIRRVRRHRGCIDAFESQEDYSE
ncbi:hypothetical protein APX70_200486 [Pseudomonas syringae pv. maculicola]|uniref:Uncharacterized protein n=1 Tax=Pseudomonas syringae pv. maculicola TaxID=59511 RepID=A0A0N0WCV2_PSEYM|nr:Unknown protein sequence [Pseudomonas syringae pv. maculicola]RML93577.1 hypothetical protein APX70_200486 [Pseudomonas syringae pv. maculicola]